MPETSGASWPRTGTAWFADRVASEVVGVTDDLTQVSEGFWGVVVTFEGEVTAVRFATVTHRPAGAAGGGAPPAYGVPGEGEVSWPALDATWVSSLDEDAYLAGVREIRRRIAAGTVYQVNLCRVLSHPLGPGVSVAPLAAILARGNPAPFAGLLEVPSIGLAVACASPEGYLVRDGTRIVSSPIKGTGVTAADLLGKDVAENVMIVDLVRHDLAPVSRVGSVCVDHLCRVEEHPGLVHLVSDVSGTLRDGVGWADLLAATFPPGSVSGAPKHTALQAIADLEPVPRGPYCGAIGWIDADRDQARLAVGIRSFWAEADSAGRRWLRFGTGSGITWGSDPGREWAETELKARRLIALASGKLLP